MNRATRDKVTSGTKQSDLTTGNACWETPPLLFEQLNEDFGPFDIDLTADAGRALCPVWFGPGSPYGPGGYDVLNVNALNDPQAVGDWSAFMVDRGFSNPPYGRFIQRLLPVARANAEHCGFTSVLLLPLRITKAFKKHAVVGAADILLPDRRITFFENGVPRCSVNKKGKFRADPAVFDSVIVRYSPDAGPVPRLGVWKVPPHVTKDDLQRAAAAMSLRTAEGVA